MATGESKLLPAFKHSVVENVYLYLANGRSYCYTNYSGKRPIGLFVPGYSVGDSETTITYVGRMTENGLRYDDEDKQPSKVNLVHPSWWDPGTRDHGGEERPSRVLMGGRAFSAMAKKRAEDAYRCHAMVRRLSVDINRVTYRKDSEVILIPFLRWFYNNVGRKEKLPDFVKPLDQARCLSHLEQITLGQRSIYVFLERYGDYLASLIHYHPWAPDLERHQLEERKDRDSAVGLLSMWRKDVGHVKRLALEHICLVLEWMFTL